MGRAFPPPICLVFWFCYFSYFNIHYSVLSNVIITVQAFLENYLPHGNCFTSLVNFYLDLRKWWLIVAPLDYEYCHGDCPRTIFPVPQLSTALSPKYSLNVLLGMAWIFLQHEFNRAIVFSLTCLCFDWLGGSSESLGDVKSLIALFLVHFLTIKQGRI